LFFAFQITWAIYLSPVKVAYSVVWNFET